MVIKIEKQAENFKPVANKNTTHRNGKTVTERISRPIVAPSAVR